jgi:uncharacterized membrane protein YjjP (DUF1212 family)
MKPAEQTTTDASDLLEFLYRLAQALIACGEQTATVELALRRASAAYGMRRSRVVAFPTAVFISLFDGQQERFTMAEGPTQVLRLDQMADVYALRDAAERAQVTPAQGRERLSAILKQPARFGTATVVFGHAIMAVGVAMILKPTALLIGTAAVLGLVVGLLKVFNRDRPVLAVPLPVIAATIVSSLVFFAIRRGLPIEPLHALVPPLVEFLPGAMLTLGMTELAYGDMVSGSSRLMAGFVQILLLVLGLAAGAAMIGYGHADLIESIEELTPPGAWERVAPWLAVFVFGCGTYLHFSAPRGSLPWILLVLYVAYATQQGTAILFGKQASGFFGMLAVTPLSYLVQLKFRGPPAMVTFLPGFWLLVPGVMSVLSVTKILSDRNAGIDGIATALFVILSLALGTLMGAALYRQLSEQFGGWNLQLGRVGRYFRPEKTNKKRDEP